MVKVDDMSELTRSEQIIIQRSCDSQGSAERRRKLMPWAFAMACCGAMLIVLGVCRTSPACFSERIV